MGGGAGGAWRGAAGERCDRAGSTRSWAVPGGAGQHGPGVAPLAGHQPAHAPGRARAWGCSCSWTASPPSRARRPTCSTAWTSRSAGLAPLSRAGRALLAERREELAALQERAPRRARLTTPSAPEKTLPPLRPPSEACAGLKRRVAGNAGAAADLLERLADEERDVDAALALAQGIDPRGARRRRPGRARPVVHGRRHAWNQGRPRVSVEDLDLAVPEGWRPRRWTARRARQPGARPAGSALRGDGVADGAPLAAVLAPRARRGPVRAGRARARGAALEPARRGRPAALPQRGPERRPGAARALALRRSGAGARSRKTWRSCPRSPSGSRPPSPRWRCPAAGREGVPRHRGEQREGRERRRACAWRRRRAGWWSRARPR